MAIYKLEEYEDVYIAPRYYGNKFHYHMTRIISETNRNNIRTIDLRSDKLMIYGTEIKQSQLDRLHESLVLRPKSGIIYVNCIGACYFYMPGKGCHRPIQNTIFDWSRFGVIVPNSSQKVVDETNELKEQLSTCQKDKQEVEMKLKKVCDQLSSIDFELETYKVELESSKKEVKELQDQLSISRKESKNKKEELQKVRDQLSSINSDLQSTTTQLEGSNRKIMELEQQLSMATHDNENKEITLHNVQEQLFTSISELENAKKQLESSKVKVKELEEELSSCKKEKQDMEQELEKVKNEVSLVSIELESTKTHLESSKKRVEELEEKLPICEDEGQITKMELKRVQCHLSLAHDELQSTKNKLETYEKQIQELKDQSSASIREAELWKALDQFKMIDSNLKSTNQKLNQLLISTMWNELDQSHHSHHPQPSPRPLSLDTPPQDTEFGDSSSDNIAISITIEEVEA